MKHILIFSILEFFILSSLLTLPTIRLDYTARLLHKHDVIKVCSIEYLTRDIELVLPTFKSWTIYSIIEYLTLGLFSSL